MKRCVAITYIVVFILLFIAPVCAYELFGGYFDQTNFEQRQAAQMPEFSLSAIDAYPRDFEAYYNDNLPFRNQLISANSRLNMRLFKKSAVDKVIMGKNDWLFYNPAGNDGDPIGDYYGNNLFSTEELELCAANLVAAKKALESQGKEFVVIIAPNKECMYGRSYLPDEFVTDNTHTRAAQVAQYLAEHTDLNVVYPKEDILTAQDNDPDHIYYYKTDTHWNSLGAYIGTRELLEQVGIQIPALQTYEISVQEKYAGDLAGMLGMADSMKYDDQYVVSEYFEGSDVEHFYPIEGNVNIACSSTANADERGLFLVRDSYGAAMIPYLGTQFNEGTYVHISQYSPDMLEQYPSDVVVLEVVERYIWNLANFKVE